jgi:YidC/Oxa1 family membrane protein insertase
MDLLWPIKWLIELILVGFHNLFTLTGMGSNSGITWVLSVAGLVVVVRAAMIPLFVKQIMSQRNMLVVQPELQKLQKKYKGKNDPESRQAFAKEQMELYKKFSANPLSSCLPLLVQMPIFFSLYSVLSQAQKDLAGVGVMTKALAGSFAHSSVFGAPLQATFVNSTDVSVKIVAATMIVLMTASQFITQRQILAKNQNPAVMTSQYMQTQKIMMYIFPIIFAISGVAFPLGVMTYWLVSNFWTMGQQFVVIRNMPTPGSQAHHDREARLAKRGKAPKSTDAPAVIEIEATESKPETTQRQQPVSKTRAKKQTK